MMGFLRYPKNGLSVVLLIIENGALRFLRAGLGICFRVPAGPIGLQVQGFGTVNPKP